MQSRMGDIAQVRFGLQCPVLKLLHSILVVHLHRLRYVICNACQHVQLALSHGLQAVIDDVRAKHVCAQILCRASAGLKWDLSNAMHAG